MRAVIRLASSAASFVFLALLVLTTETAADELGLVSKVRTFIRGGWTAVTDSGYVMAVHAAFWLCSGVALTLWIDYFIRKARTGTAGRSMACFDLLAEDNRKLFDDLRAEHAGIVEIGPNSYVVDMVFSDTKPLYITALLADGPCTWKELVRKDRYLRVAVHAETGAKITAISLLARPFEGQDDRFVMQEHVWQKAYLDGRFSVLHIKGESRSLEWQLGTGPEKPL